MNTCTALVPTNKEQQKFGNLVLRQVKAERKADLGKAFDKTAKDYTKAQLAVEQVAQAINAHGGRLQLKTDDDGNQYLIASAATQKAKLAYQLANRKVQTTIAGRILKAPNVYSLYAALQAQGVKLPKLQTFPDGSYKLNGLQVAKRLEDKGFPVELR